MWNLCQEGCSRHATSTPLLSRRAFEADWTRYIKYKKDKLISNILAYPFSRYDFGKNIDPVLLRLQKYFCLCTNKTFGQQSSVPTLLRI